MSDSQASYVVGMLVEHPNRPAWGPGKVLCLGGVGGSKITVYFRDVEEQNLNDAVKIMDTNLVQLRVAATQTDPMLDNLPPFTDGAFKSTKPRLSLEQGEAIFLKHFPMGFKDPGYIGDLKTGERAYKLHACRLYADTLGDGKAEKLLEIGNVAELRDLMLRVVGKTNLLYLTEAAALRDGLKDDEAARRFFKALLALLSSNLDEERFDALKGALELLPVEQGKTNPCKWTVVTIFPFLAQPHRHLFIKPESLKAGAELLRFHIQYRASPNWITYCKVLEMANLLLERLQRLGACDMIDVQGFMYVIWADRKWGYIPD